MNGFRNILRVCLQQIISLSNTTLTSRDSGAKLADRLLKLVDLGQGARSRRHSLGTGKFSTRSLASKLCFIDSLLRTVTDASDVVNHGVCITRGQDAELIVSTWNITLNKISLDHVECVVEQLIVGDVLQELAAIDRSHSRVRSIEADVDLCRNVRERRRDAGACSDIADDLLRILRRLVRGVGALRDLLGAGKRIRDLCERNDTALAKRFIPHPDLAGASHLDSIRHVERDLTNATSASYNACNSWNSSDLKTWCNDLSSHGYSNRSRRNDAVLHAAFTRQSATDLVVLKNVSEYGLSTLNASKRIASTTKYT